MSRDGTIEPGEWELPSGRREKSYVQKLSPIIALVLATGIPLESFTMQNLSSFGSTFQEELSLFFLLAYFPTISAIAPLGYFLFSKLRYGKAWGLGWFAFVTVATSFILVGIVWFYLIVGFIALSGGQ
jgi:heme/copper-type cytochrome/quinol oxidase subunit 4